MLASSSSEGRAPESVRPGEETVEWTRLKNGSWLGCSGSQILCIVDKLEDFPVEGWTPQCFRDVFTTPEAAMVAGELLLRSIRHQQEETTTPPISWVDIYLPILKSVVAALEDKSLLAGRSTSNETQKPTEAKS
jgi:hypothetical protein